MFPCLVGEGADPAFWFGPNEQGRTPLRIARGFRPGNIKPSAPIEAALVEVLRKAGVAIPPVPPCLGPEQREGSGGIETGGRGAQDFQLSGRSGRVGWSK
jgi:hypothetical protein